MMLTVGQSVNNNYDEHLTYPQTINSNSNSATIPRLVMVALFA
ncbi:hypothetical protein [Lentilactobacillus fungorum]|nr:hypothetical protein [Lentilactobacillus fungorum]